MGLFDAQIARKPVVYPWANGFIESIWETFWTPKEFTFSSDKQKFKVNCTPEEKKIIVNTLSAIGQIEINVKKFWSRLGDNLPRPELADLGHIMANTEVIHNKAYEKLLDTLGITDVFEENLKLDVIGGRVKYLSKYLEKNYTDNRKQYIYSIILFTLFVENVSLFSQFYVVLWFDRYKNYFKDTAQQVQYTKNEELLHAMVGVKIIQTLRVEYPELFDAELEQRILSEARSAFIAEAAIIDWMLGSYNERNISAAILKEYVKDRINDSLALIGYPSVFVIDPELLAQTKWMTEDTLGSAFTDFFAKRPTDYAKHNRAYNTEDLF